MSAPIASLYHVADARRRMEKAAAAVSVKDLFCAIAHDYGELHGALRLRAEQLNLSRRNIDYVAGLTDGYSSKLLGPRPMKNLGPASMGRLLRALGLRIILIDDRDALAKAAGRFEERQIRQVRRAASGAICVNRKKATAR